MAALFRVCLKDVNNIGNFGSRMLKKVFKIRKRGGWGGGSKLSIDRIIGGAMGVQAIFKIMGGGGGRGLTPASTPMLYVEKYKYVVARSYITSRECHSHHKQLIPDTKRKVKKTKKLIMQYIRYSVNHAI